MKNKIASLFWIVFILWNTSASGQSNQLFTIEQIRVANQTKVFADGCKIAFDTLSVSYDALLQSEAELLKANKTLANSLEMSKAVSQGLDAEKILAEKQLKKEIRKKKFNGIMLYAVSGVAVVTTVLLLIK